MYSPIGLNNADTEVRPPVGYFQYPRAGRVAGSSARIYENTAGETGLYARQCTDRLSLWTYRLCTTYISTSAR
jgi:hypothetical protein